VGAALVARHRVDLVDDDRAHRAQHRAPALAREEDVERLRRGDEDVRGLPRHRRALARRRVSGPDEHARSRTRHRASRAREAARRDFSDVVPERLEGQTYSTSASRPGVPIPAGGVRPGPTGTRPGSSRFRGAATRVCPAGDQGHPSPEGEGVPIRSRNHWRTAGWKKSSDIERLSGTNDYRDYTRLSGVRRWSQDLDAAMSRKP
jgi:hypothetical protein